MTLRAEAIVVWTVLLLAVGCVSRGKVVVGRAFGPADAPPTAAGAAVAGAAGSGNTVLVAVRAGSSSTTLGYEPLNAHIQDIQGLTLAIVTVKCGDCADIVVVAGGGHGPYAFAWEDGSTNAQRHVCPAAGAELSVTATDTPLHDAEFPYAGQTTMARVKTETLACGAPGSPDAGVPPGACAGKPAVVSFDAELKWAFDGPPNEPNSIVTPLVANLTDDNGDGKIDLRDTPDVVVVTGPNAVSGHLSVLDGATGKLHFTAAREVATSIAPALGDLDGDGTPEIATIDAQSRIVIFRHDGTVAYTGDAYMAPITGSGAMAIANVDGEGAPEIITPNGVFDAHGKQRWQIYPLYVGLSEPVAADLDGDGKLEVLIGASCYRFDGTSCFKLQDNGARTSIAIANVDADPEPEVLLVDGNGIRVVSHDGKVQLEVSKPTLGGFPIFVFDLDGDSAPEFGVPDYTTISLFHRDASLLWSAPETDASGMAGATAFDLLGTGHAQILLADETAFHVWDSAGKELFNVPRSSNTGIEYPVVADIDNDGAAEILIVSDRLGIVSDLPPLRVFHDPQERWMPARRIWNESAYHVTNVNEDGTIPLHEEPSWKALNTFRAQAAGCWAK